MGSLFRSRTGPQPPDKDDDRPEERVVRLILSQAVEDNAKQILIQRKSDRVTVRYVVDDQEQDVMSPPAHVFEGLRTVLLEYAGLADSAERISQQGSFLFEGEGKETRFRVWVKEQGELLVVGR